MGYSHYFPRVGWCSNYVIRTFTKPWGLSKMNHCDVEWSLRHLMSLDLLSWRKNSKPIPNQSYPVLRPTLSNWIVAWWISYTHWEKHVPLTRFFFFFFWMANHIQTISSSGVFIVGFTTIKEIFGAGWLCVSRPDTGTPTGRCRGPDLVGVIPWSERWCSAI